MTKAEKKNERVELLNERENKDSKGDMMAAEEK